ncbi:MAG: hypothetical protein SNJ57_15855 [Cyanobacteriota bacterium]
MSKRKTRADSERLWEYALVAREAWAIKPGHSSVRGSLRVPAHLAPSFEAQSSEERGAAWADGYLVREQIAVLYRVLHSLSAGKNISHIQGNVVTVLVGQDAFEAPTHMEALLLAINHYLPPKEAIGQQDFDLEERLGQRPHPQGDAACL